jgi:hypothetical protein
VARQELLWAVPLVYRRQAESTGQPADRNAKHFFSFSTPFLKRCCVVEKNAQARMALVQGSHVKKRVLLCLFFVCMFLAIHLSRFPENASRAAGLGKMYEEFM